MATIVNDKLIIKNTIVLYTRNIILLFVGLYASKIILQELGAEDFGIYNVVGGIVGILGFLSAAISNATQRFYSYDIGKGDIGHLIEIFNVSFVLYIFISVIIVLISEILGIWLIRYKLIIPEDRLVAANVVFQFSVISFIIVVLMTPYKSLIIAHEKMSIFGFVSIVEALLKLLTLVVLSFSYVDKLILYSFCVFIINLLQFLVFLIFCKKSFSECRLKRIKNLVFLKEMSQYISFTLLGNIAGSLYNQGTSVLLNMFYGPIINTARAISMQVNGAVCTFSGQFTVALQPQLIKNYSAQDFSNVWRQLYFGTKITYLLIFVFSLPLSFEINYVLTLWLGDFPIYTSIFTILLLIANTIDVLNYGVDTLVQASGKIRLYQTCLSIISLCNIPFSYFALKFGALPYYTIIINILLKFITIILRIIILQKLITQFNIKEYFVRVLLPIVIISIITLPLPLLIITLFTESFLRLTLTSLVTFTETLIFSWFLFFNSEERNKIRYFIKTKIKRV